MLYLENEHTLQYHRAYKPQLLRYALEEQHFEVSAGYSVTRYIIF